MHAAWTDLQKASSLVQFGPKTRKLWPFKWKHLRGLHGRTGRRNRPTMTGINPMGCPSKVGGRIGRGGTRGGRVQGVRNLVVLSVSRRAYKSWTPRRVEGPYVSEEGLTSHSQVIGGWRYDGASVPRSAWLRGCTLMQACPSAWRRPSSSGPSASPCRRWIDTTRASRSSS